MNKQTKQELKEKLNYITEGILTNESRSIKRLDEVLTLSESRVRGEALTDMFLEIAKLAEPDERQSSSGDLHTNMDDIWEIKKRLASITKKEGE